MAGIGRAPEPTKLRILRGNPSKRPINDAEPNPDANNPSCPEFLDAVAKAEWKRIIGVNKKLKLLTLLDRACLAGYCQAYSRWRSAEESIVKKGMSYKLESGQQRIIPEVNIAREWLTAMLAFCDRIGLSPSARTRIRLEHKSDVQPRKYFRNAE
jgi:P27 family predicted phage terminase small subunit